MSVVKRIDGELVYKLPSEHVVSTGKCGLCGVSDAKKNKGFLGVNKVVKPKIVEFISERDDCNICQSCSCSLNAVIGRHTHSIKDNYLVHDQPQLEDYDINPIFHYEYKELVAIGDEFECDKYGGILDDEEQEAYSNACELVRMSFNRLIHDCDTAFESIKASRLKVLSESDEDIELMATQFLVNLLKREENRIKWEAKYNRKYYD